MYIHIHNHTFTNIQFQWAYSQDLMFLIISITWSNFESIYKCNFITIINYILFEFCFIYICSLNCFIHSASLLWMHVLIWNNTYFLNKLEVKFLFVITLSASDSFLFALFLLKFSHSLIFKLLFSLWSRCVS